MSRFAMMNPDDWEERMDSWIDRADSAEPWDPQPPSLETSRLTVEERCRCGFPWAPGELVCSQCGGPRP